MNVTHTHPLNGPFSGTTQVIQYQKVKTNLDFTEARDSEWHHHSSCFTDRMPNQQHQITEGMCECNTDENWMYDVGCLLCNAYKFVIRFLSFCSHIATQKFSSVIKSSVLCIIFCRFHIIANVIVLRGVIILYYMLYDAFFW